MTMIMIMIIITIQVSIPPGWESTEYKLIMMHYDHDPEQNMTMMIIMIIQVSIPPGWESTACQPGRSLGSDILPAQPLLQVLLITSPCCRCFFSWCQYYHQTQYQHNDHNRALLSTNILQAQPLLQVLLTNIMNM